MKTPAEDGGRLIAGWQCDSGIISAEAFQQELLKSKKSCHQGIGIDTAVLETLFCAMLRKILKELDK